MRSHVLTLTLLRFGLGAAALIVCPVLLTAQDKVPDSEPKLLSSTTYTLPQAAVDAEIDGAVIVAFQIDKTGMPTTAVMAAGPVWPCGKTPRNAIDEVSKTLSAEMMKLKFSPAIKNGKPVAAEFGLKLELKNPNLNSGPVERDPATGKPRPRYINGGILNGKATSLPKPEYPAEARSIGASGTVTVQVLVDEKGKVVRAGAISGHPALQFASRDAACSVKFAPTKLEGQPIMVSGTILYNFVP